MYLSTRTRPDITFAVCNVAKYCSNPSVKHWVAVKRIFRYLKGTIDLGIHYSKVDSELVGYSDADWAGDRSDRRSTSGYCFVLSGGVVSWRCCKQSCVALSTAESEYVALSGASQEAIWLNKFLSDVHFGISKPVTIFEDNQSAISIAKNIRTSGKTKHIDIKFHFIRDMIKLNKIKLLYCPSSDNLADVFTKSLASDKFCKFRNNLGMSK